MRPLIYITISFIISLVVDTEYSSSVNNQKKIWEQVETTLKYRNVTTVSLDFDLDGFPVLPFEILHPNAKSNIPVYAYNGKSLTKITERVSQFGQGYHEFIFKVRQNVEYLGLKIHYRYSSVLNGAVAYRESHAFYNQLFDFEIDSEKNMIMFLISQLATNHPGTDNELMIVRYDKTDWTNYLAGNIFEKIAERSPNK